jgi:benzoate-CoA ligase
VSSIAIPRDYNAAPDLIERNLRAGRGAKVAYVDDDGSCTFGELAERVNRFANALTGLGIEREQRVLLCMHDTIDFPTVFLGSIKAGVVPVAVNTVLTPAEYAYMLEDSRARALVVSEALLARFSAYHPPCVIVSGEEAGGHLLLADVLAKSDAHFEAAPTCCDEPCFWLYSSGSTGPPKGTVHVHSSLIQTAELYARPILGITESDVVFSAAKLFFAYGLGNSLSFPLAAGATTILMKERATPASVFARLLKHQPTIFYGVPTLYAAMLASPDLPPRGALRLRHCVSAGEALPENIGKRWSEHFGVDILDGIGSTEMLHIYLSNGRPVPGYQVRLGDGELYVAGPTSALGYWNQRDRSRATFQGEWTCTGDKFTLSEDGCYVYAGRTDDMLKVGGIYVSPAEVEAALVTHEAVLEAAVIGREDAEKLVKPVAFVVLKSGRAPCEALAEELKQHVKSRLAPYKYPRWIEFIEELPKTGTGKVQRFKLRART